jgi:hypothetical protein
LFWRGFVKEKEKEKEEVKEEMKEEKKEKKKKRGGNQYPFQYCLVCMRNNWANLYYKHFLGGCIEHLQCGNILCANVNICIFCMDLVEFCDDTV